MVQPKPISVTQASTNPSSNRGGPKPYLIVGTLPEASVPAATTSVRGTVKKAASQATFAGADVTALKVELNAWYAKLQAAGIVT